MKRNHLGIFTTLFLSLGLSIGACDRELEDDVDTLGGEAEGKGDELSTSDSDSMSTGDGAAEGGEGDSADTGENDTLPTTDGGSDPTGDGDPTGGSGGDPTGGSGGDPTGEAGGEMDGFAIAFGDLPDLEPGESTGGTSGGGSEIPDDAMSVTVSSSGEATCDSPYAAEPCGGNWSVSFTLMPSMLEGPGTYNLIEDANGSFSISDALSDAGECSGGWGSLDGVLVIEEVNADAIVGHLEGTDAFDFDADISFVAAFCE